MRLSIVFGCLLFGLIAAWLSFNPFKSRAETRSLSLTTDTQSSQFATQEEAITFLEPYVTLPTEVEKLAYHIVYYDNSQGIPGPSDWDMKIAVKVSPQNLEQWLEGFTLSSEPFDILWGHEYAKTESWNLNSEPRFYEKLGEQLAVYESEGVILMWLSTF